MSKMKKLSKKKTEPVAEHIAKKVSTEEDKKVFVKDLKKEETLKNQNQKKKQKESK